jgi:hypothetical protein
VKGYLKVEITTISVAVRYSREMGNQWKGLELKAEANLSPEESKNWQQSMDNLYRDMAQQMVRQWNSYRKRDPTNVATSQVSSPSEPKTEAA